MLRGLPSDLAGSDGKTPAGAGPFAGLLLRTEAAGSSQIENLTSSAKAIALAELGRRGHSNADEIVANELSMMRALDLGGPLDGAAIRAMHHALTSGTAPAGAGTWREEQVWIGGSSRSPHGAPTSLPCISACRRPSTTWRSSWRGTTSPCSRTRH